jgi:hypothetical protein
MDSRRIKRPKNNIIKKINDMYGGECIVGDWLGTIGALFCKTVGGVTAVDILLIFISYLNYPELHLT